MSDLNATEEELSDGKILGILSAILDRPEIVLVPTTLNDCFDEMRARVLEIRAERAAFAEFYAHEQA